jgi:hypothetical protein
MLKPEIMAYIMANPDLDRTIETLTELHSEVKAQGRSGKTGALFRHRDGTIIPDINDEVRDWTNVKQK